MHPNPEPVVENATPSLEIELQMQPLRLKLVQGSAENATPSSEIGVGVMFAGAENRTPQPEITSNMQPLKQKICAEMPNVATLSHEIASKMQPSYRKYMCDCFTASYDKHFGAQEIAPLRTK